MELSASAFSPGRCQESLERNMIKNIIFDMGNVLSLWNPKGPCACLRARLREAVGSVKGVST